MPKRKAERVYDGQHINHFSWGSYCWSAAGLAVFKTYAPTSKERREKEETKRKIPCS